MTQAVLWDSLEEAATPHSGTAADAHQPHTGRGTDPKEHALCDCPIPGGTQLQGLIYHTSC